MLVCGFLFATACKTPNSTTTTTTIMTSSSAPPATSVSIASTPLAGTLVNVPFHVAKAILSTQPEGAKLDLYSWSEGDACAPQFAPKPEQLYVSMTLPPNRATRGATLRSSEPGVLVIYKQPTISVTHSDATVIFDDVGSARATGRLSLTAPDGTNVSGSFNATVCASAQHAASASSVDGVAWGTEVDPQNTPHDPVSTILTGTTAKPAAVESIDWDDGSLAQHEIHFFMKAPAKSCAFDQMSPGFKLGFPSAFRKGLSMRATTTTVTARGQPWVTAMWKEPGDVLGMEGGGFVSAIIDDATPTELRGRVVAWVNDASKSMIAGAFVAKRCHVTP